MQKALPSRLARKRTRTPAVPPTPDGRSHSSALVPGEVAPLLVDQTMVESMASWFCDRGRSHRPGRQLHDQPAGRGGDPRGCNYRAVQNIPGSVPIHASWLYANNLLHYVNNLFQNGSINWDDDIVKATLVTHEGQIVHAGARKAMGLV